MAPSQYFAGFGFLFTLLSVPATMADTLTVAVAANFTGTLYRLAERFEKTNGHKMRISSASTGKLYAQINHDAPFDVFMSADEIHADWLVKEGKADPSHAGVYALGKLVFISNIAPDGQCQNVLSDARLKRLAIANPHTAPYGAAARQVMEHLGVWDKLQAKLLPGESISQTAQFVASTSADAGFVAKSALTGDHVAGRGCEWVVPDNLYAPIRQKMVVLNRSKDKPAVLAFWLFMHSNEAADIVRDSGYDVPGASKRRLLAPTEN